MKILDLIFGRPLESAESENITVGVGAGIPILGLDALSSAAYGPEAALTMLIPLGVFGIAKAGPIIGVIVALLLVLFFSYRQTIEAYPNGGGSYIVAHKNLGVGPGLLAAAALLLDYVLTVAVGISAGVGALISAVPALHPYTLLLCLAILVFITLINLRGVRESGIAFSLPTYLFVVSLIGVLIYGVVKAVAAGGHPQPVEVPPVAKAAWEMATPWLLIRAFASGCTAMTGVEAVSNGIQIFNKPKVFKAQQTLGAIVLILTVLLMGIGYLCSAYHIVATDPTSPAYESVISQIVAAIVGRGVFYYVTLASVIAVLALSANTGFADFPRLCRLLAEDEFLPHMFTVRGRRLAYSTGIMILSLLCGILLIAFGGITDRLIPLFAIGAFMAFTLSQAGMVKHWQRRRGAHSKASLAINLVGAICTGIALVVVIVAKFMDGAWITMLLIPATVFLFWAINRHYRWVRRKTACSVPVKMTDIKPPIVLLPVKLWDTVIHRALIFAMALTPDVIAIHVDDEEGEEWRELRRRWEMYVVEPLEEQGIQPPTLKHVFSPYRRFIAPILAEVRQVQHEHPDRMIAVVVPELVETTFWTWILHNQRGGILKAALLISGERGVAVISVPWYLGHGRVGIRSQNRKKGGKKAETH